MTAVVFHVDDDPKCREIFRERAVTRGIHVLSFSSSVDAVSNPEFPFVSGMVVDSVGINVALQARIKTPNIPVVYLASDIRNAPSEFGILSFAAIDKNQPLAADKTLDVLAAFWDRPSHFLMAIPARVLDADATGTNVGFYIDDQWSELHLSNVDSMPEKLGIGSMIELDIFARVGTVSELAGISSEILSELKALEDKHAKRHTETLQF